MSILYQPFQRNQAFVLPNDNYFLPIQHLVEHPGENNEAINSPQIDSISLSEASNPSDSLDTESSTTNITTSGGGTLHDDFEFDDFFNLDILEGASFRFDGSSVEGATFYVKESKAIGSWPNP